MKLSDYRDQVLEMYPDAFVDHLPEQPGWQFIYTDSSRSAIVGSGGTILGAWHDAYLNLYGQPGGENWWENDES